MKKQIKLQTVLIIICIVILVYTLIPKNENILSIKFYDSDGNLIKNQLSVVNGVLGISAISFVAKVDNQGNVPLTCSVTDGSPIEFYQVMEKTLKVVPTGGFNTWESDILPLNQFETLTQPVNFTIEVLCKYKQGEQTIELNKRYGEVSLRIEEEYVVFRTSELSYGTHSTIAFTDTCRNELTPYTRKQTTCWTQTDQNCPIKLGYDLRMQNIQQNLLWTETPGCLYTRTDYPERVYLAFKTTSTASGPCSISGRWGVYLYENDLTDPDIGNVELSNQVIDISRERTCV